MKFRAVGSRVVGEILPERQHVILEFVADSFEDCCQAAKHSLRKLGYEFWSLEEIREYPARKEGEK